MSYPHMDAPITLFPTETEIERARAATYKGSYQRIADGGRIVEPSSPITGSEWTQRAVDDNTYRFHATGLPAGGDKLPSIVFDATRLSIALDQIAHDATAKAWQMNEALRNVRVSVEGSATRDNAIIVLNRLYRNIMMSADTELKARMHVNDLADTIDMVCPSQSKLMQPVRDFIKKVKDSFKR